MKILKNLIKFNFKDLYRQKFFHIIIFLSFLMIFFGVYINSLDNDIQIRIISEFTLTFISFINLFLILFICGDFIKKDFEKKFVFNIFSKPVKRSTYLLAKIITLFIFFSALTVYMSTFIFVVIYITKKLLFFEVLKAAFFLILKAIITISILTYLSLKMTRAISATIAFTYYLIAHFTGFFNEILNSYSTIFQKIFSYIFIDMNTLNSYKPMIYNIEIPFVYYLIVLFYAISFSMIFIYLSINHLEKSEIV